jgi:8-oxo-dGTP diphosphatase
MMSFKVWLETTEPHPTAAIIVVREGKALILRRGMTAPWMPGAWNLPGGMMDEGESPQAAAERECFEETGIRPTGVKFRRRIADPGFTLYLFTGETNEANPRLDHENDGFAWASMSDLKHYQFVPYVAGEISKVLAASAT